MDPYGQPADDMNPYDIQPAEDQLHDLGMNTPEAPQTTPAVNTIGATSQGAIRQSNIFCVQCGYNLTGIAIGSTCPECGTHVESSMLAHQLPTSGKSIASLVLGICSIPLCIVYGIPSVVCGALSVWFAYAARAQVRDGDVGPGSKGMATAGLVCGIIGLCLGLVYVAIFVGFVILLRRP